MKQRLLILLCLCLLFSACTPPAAPAAPTAAATLVPSATLPPTETATPAPTHTPAPTATATATPEPTATETPIPSPTPTAMPPLEEVSSGAVNSFLDDIYKDSDWTGTIVLVGEMLKYEWEPEQQVRLLLLRADSQVKLGKLELAIADLLAANAVG